MGPEDLRATARELPRLKGKSWWLTKQVQTFAVQEMRDLEFEPAVPILASELRTAEGSGPAHCLAQFGTRALPIVLAGLQSADRSERLLALSILAERVEPRRPTRLEARPQESGPRPMDPRLVTPLLKLLSDDDARTRQKACEAVAANWDPIFAPRLTDLLRDSDDAVREAAFNCLRIHEADLGLNCPLPENGRRRRPGCLEGDGLAQYASGCRFNERAVGPAFVLHEPARSVDGRRAACANRTLTRANSLRC